MTDFLSWVGVVGSALGAIAAGVVGFYLQPRAIRAAEGTESPTLEGRLEKLGDAMRLSRQLISQVEAELAARAATAARLKEEAEAAEALVNLTREERDAVARLVRAEVGAESRRTFRDSLIANALFFIAGIGISVMVVLFVHPL